MEEIMAYEEDKKYFVVSFLDLPYPNIERYVCVPKSWVTVRPEQRYSLVAYPNENPALTRNRIENIEGLEKDWTRYKATVEYITNVYDDADAWIATMYDDGVANSNKSSNTPYHYLLTSASSSVVPKNEPFDADTLLKIKKEDVESPPPIGMSTWELISSASSSPFKIEPEETPSKDSCTDITNPARLKRTISPNPDQNNNAKQPKLPHTASVHDNSNVSDKPLESNNDISEKVLESYVSTFFNELQSLLNEQTVTENRASDNNTVMNTASTSTSSTTTSQASTSSNIHNGQPPGLPTKPLISVLPDEYLLENRARSDTPGFRNDSRDIPPQLGPANKSAAQTLIHLSNVYKELSQAVPTTSQSHLQLPFRAPLVDTRSSKANNSRYIAKIAQQPIDTVQQVTSQQTQIERSLLRKSIVPQSNSQMKVSGEAGMRNNQDTPPRSLPEPQSSCQLSMPELESIIDNPEPFSPSNNLVIVESPDSSCVNTEIPQNPASTSTGNNLQAKNQLSGQQMEYQNSAAYKIHAEQGEISKIVANNANELGNNDQKSTQIRNNSVSSTSIFPSIGINPGFQKPLVPLTVELLSNPEIQQQFRTAQSKDDIKHRNVPKRRCIRSSSIKEILEQPKKKDTIKANKQECSKVANLESEPSSDNNLTLLVKGYLLQDPSTGIVFVQPCPGQNILEPGRSILNPIKQEHTGNTTSNDICRHGSPHIERQQSYGVCTRQHSQSQERFQDHRIKVTGPCQIPDPQMVSQNGNSMNMHDSSHRSEPETSPQNTPHSMHMNCSNYRPDPQMNSQSFTQQNINSTHQRFNPQNTLHPIDMHGNDQRSDTQMAPQSTRNAMNHNNQNSPRMKPEDARHSMYTNSNYHRPDDQIDPHIPKRTTYINGAHQTVKYHQNTLHQMDVHGNSQRANPQIGSQNTQDPMNINNCNNRSDFQMGPPNFQNPMTGGNQRFDPPRGQQSTRQSMENNNVHQRPNPQINPPHIRDNSNSIQRSNPPTVPQNARYSMNVPENSQRSNQQIYPRRDLYPSNANIRHHDFDPQMDSQTNRQIMTAADSSSQRVDAVNTNDRNRRTDPQINPQYTQHLMNSNSQFDPQMFLQNTLQPKGGNSKLFPQMNTQSSRCPMDGSNQQFEQMKPQNSRQAMPMNNYNYRPDPQMGFQITQNSVNYNNQRTNPQMNPQSTLRPMIDSKYKPDHQMCPQNNRDPMYGTYQRSDAQMNSQITRQPMHMNNCNLQMSPQNSRNPINSNQLHPIYVNGPNQNIDSQLITQNNGNPMDGSYQRTDYQMHHQITRLPVDVNGTQQRIDTQMGPQNNRAQNWNTGNQSSRSHNSYVSQSSPVSQNRNEVPQMLTVAERSIIDYARQGLPETRPMQTQNSCVGYPSDLHTRNSDEQRLTSGPHAYWQFK